MKLTDDPKANVAYIRFRERTGAVATIRLTDDCPVDVDDSGAACGLELLNANEQMVEGDNGKLLVVDSFSCETREVKMTGLAPKAPESQFNSDNFLASDQCSAYDDCGFRAYTLVRTSRMEIPNWTSTT